MIKEYHWENNKKGTDRTSNKVKEVLRKTIRKDNILKIGIWNVRSLTGKENELVEELERGYIDILGITERKRKGIGELTLPGGKGIGELTLPGGHLLIYSAVEKERRATEGVACYIKKEHTKYNTVNVTNLQLTRLGKFTHEKKRPIKVTLVSKADVLKTLKNKKKTDSTIKIQADLTLMQRQYLVELRSKLSDLNKSGANKTIRLLGTFTAKQRQYLVELRSKLSDLNKSGLRSKLSDLNKSGANKTIRYIHGKPQIIDAKN
ncbi:hypothetical protein QE152_g29679 [Popillia japonica]|uniref:Uncharacterized protein n=1 Tax=Popillia japonica TaxID=7064 RepID=A0AAW1JH43_POPJA